jgi:hypothetical protein
MGDIAGRDVERALLDPHRTGRGIDAFGHDPPLAVQFLHTASAWRAAYTWGSADGANHASRYGSMRDRIFNPNVAVDGSWFRATVVERRWRSSVGYADTTLQLTVSEPSTMNHQLRFSG